MPTDDELGVTPTLLLDELRGTLDELRGTLDGDKLERATELGATLERGADEAGVELTLPPPICTSIQPWKRS